MKKSIINTKFRIILTLLSTLLAPAIAFAVVQSLNGAIGQSQTFVNDTNLTINTDPSLNTHTLGWFGQLPVSRGGTGNDAFIEGSIIFMGQNKFRQDNSNFFWDRVNNRLGIGTSAPASTLDVFGNASISGNLEVAGNIISANLVPYVGATSDADLGTHNLTATSLISISDANINSLTVGKGGGSNLYSTAFGNSALKSNAGSKNTGMGFCVMCDAVLTGSNNTGVGYSSLRFLGSNSNDNTALGYYSLISLGSGSGNTGIGDNSLVNLPVGSYNTALGFNSGANLVSNTTNSITIGYNVDSAGSNTVVIGNVSIKNVYLGSSSGASKLHIANLNINNLPTSPSGLVAGDIWNNDGVLNVVAGNP